MNILRFGNLDFKQQNNETWTRARGYDLMTDFELDKGFQFFSLPLRKGICNLQVYKSIIHDA